jgi:hypothetical protein
MLVVLSVVFHGFLHYEVFYVNGSHKNVIPGFHGSNNAVHNIKVSHSIGDPWFLHFIPEVQCKRIKREPWLPPDHVLACTLCINDVATTQRSVRNQTSAKAFKADYALSYPTYHLLGGITIHKTYQRAIAQPQKDCTKCPCIFDVFFQEKFND